jgi:hypothetical protein
MKPQNDHDQANGQTVFSPDAPAQAAAPATPTDFDGKGPALAGPATGTNRPSKRRLYAIVGVAVAVAVGLAAYAFAFYLPNRPANVWDSALSNTGKGYDKLVDYLASEKLAERYKATELSGTFAYDDGGFKTDGTLQFATDEGGKNVTFSGDVGMGITRAKVEGLFKDAANSESPDVYFKASGIKGLGALAGLPQLDALDNQWIVVDHTLIDSFAASSASSGSLSNPSEEDFVEAARAVGEVNNKYLFNADQADAVFSMREYVGTQQVDGKDTMHFKVGASKTNLKRYLKELGQELDKTKLNDWTKDTFKKPISELLELDKAAKTADQQIKDGETFDAWVNTETKMLHKVRFAGDNQPQDNYVEFVLNYNGGDELPFALNIRSTEDDQDVTASLAMTLNMDNDRVGLSADIKNQAPENPSEGSFDLILKPGSGNVNAEVPEGAVSVIEALMMAGLADILGPGGNTGGLEEALGNEILQSL